MGTVGKIGIGLVVAVIAVIAVVSSLVVSNLDGIIKQIIEDAGSKAIGTSVTLDSATLSLQDGRGELHGLTIANPPGYDSAYAFRMEQVALQVDPLSLSGDVIVIKEILIDGAVLLAEQKATSTNLKELLDSMGGSSAEPATPAESAVDVRLMVEQFSFINNSATLLTSQWGDKSLDIPDIKMSNIGDTETGLTPQQLANRMTTTLIKQAEQAVADYLEQLAKDAAQAELERQMDKNLSEDDKQKVNALKSMFKKE
jgi:uncharacterized protein involved in outer membrane biogenesis